jgi:hypothetical protein
MLRVKIASGAFIPKAFASSGSTSSTSPSGFLGFHDPVTDKKVSAGWQSENYGAFGQDVLSQ